MKLLAPQNVQILFIADVIGSEGYEIMRTTIAGLKKTQDFDLIIANGENGASGKGLTPRLVEDYFDAGVCRDP